MPTCHIAGYPIPQTDPLELAFLVDNTELADRLEYAYAHEVRVLALDVDERETILWGLDEPPPTALAELRAVLLQEHVGRKRDGLV